MTSDASDPRSAVWRRLSAEDLEREYSPSSMVPALEPFLAAYAGRSSAARAEVVHERLVFGDHPDEWLWYVPPPEPGGPLHVFVHGGYWRRLSADDGTFPAVAFRAAGCGFASLNYSLAPATPLRAITDQARRALSFLCGPGLAHDPARVYGSGHSAGAQLLAIALLDAPLAGASFVSGIFDLEPVSRIRADEPLGLAGDDLVTLSPLRNVPITEAPAVVAWAERDTDEFRRQSLQWAAAWGDAGNRPPVAFEVPDRNHFDVVFDLGDPGTLLGRAVLGQMESV
jgi:arylformamidase